MAEVHGIMSGILRIMHPECYHTACEAMDKIRTCPKFADLINQWGCPFNALSIIINRFCGAHRDNKSRMEYFDILASFGDFKNFVFHMESVGVQANLKPGGVVGLCGNIIVHEANECAGNRVCYAWYMRRTVQMSMEVRPAGFMNQQIYKDFVKDPKWWFNRDWIQPRL